MGQAAVDLPDPLEPGSAKGNADDLLAQLAGEEVDRLLAEADLDVNARKPAEQATTPPVVEAANGAVDEAADFLSTSATFEAPPESQAQAVAAELEADEAIHNQLNGASPATIGTLATETPADASDVDDAPLAPLPILVRPLAWLNAPLALLPDAIRELVGKIALLTMFNAIAVLLYVLIFRKHGK